MIKKWSENCTVKLKSFQIENKVVEFFANDEYSDKEYPALVRNFFEYFYNSASDNDLKSYLNTALSRAKKACEFEENDNLDDAVVEWQKIFGADFPITLKKEEVNSSLEDKIQGLYKLYPSAKEEYLKSKYGIDTALNPGYVLKIDADIEQNGFRNNLLSNFILRKLPLLKN